MTDLTMIVWPGLFDNPHCACRAFPAAAMTCQSGHLTECHFPYQCMVAGCSHLEGYGVDPVEAAAARQEMIAYLESGDSQFYTLTPEGRLVPINVPEGDTEQDEQTK